MPQVEQATPDAQDRLSRWARVGGHRVVEEEGVGGDRRQPVGVAVGRPHPHPAEPVAPTAAEYRNRPRAAVLPRRLVEPLDFVPKRLPDGLREHARRRPGVDDGFHLEPVGNRFRTNAGYEPAGYDHQLNQESVPGDVRNLSGAVTRSEERQAPRLDGRRTVVSLAQPQVIDGQLDAGHGRTPSGHSAASMNEMAIRRPGRPLARFTRSRSSFGSGPWPSNRRSNPFWRAAERRQGRK